MLHFAISLIMNINLAQSPRPLQRKRKKNAITAVVDEWFYLICWLLVAASSPSPQHSMASSLFANINIDTPPPPLQL
jgi:hypothetical protein